MRGAAIFDTANSLCDQEDFSEDNPSVIERLHTELMNIWDILLQKTLAGDLSSPDNLSDDQRESL